MIIVGLSGGVDSSVAALLLTGSGRDTAGLFMKNWEEDDNETYCAAAVDVEDARGVCRKLDIPLHTVNLSAEYWDQVFEDFLAGYRAGQTPNPDILCNREIKFKAFLEHAQDLGAERIATGHYARIAELDGRYRLLKARDRGKDQSYFLHALNQYQLACAEFPLGDLEKPQVRKMAAEAGLETYAKKDSTGICFIGERPFREFLSRYLPARPGEIHSLDGRVLGTHAGAAYFTLGQRKGLALGGITGAAAAPWYVVDKDVAANIVYVAQGHDHPLLYSRELETHEVNWIGGETPPLPLICTAKTRYRQAEQRCCIEEAANSGYRVTFDEPQWAVTAGQSVVFYAAEECLGGGVIVNTTR
jgi:tRNA-specific 2-thiouridylase